MNINFINFQSTIVVAWDSVEKALKIPLNNLDPSLFQNVIIGILMVLIFIGEQIFSEVKTQQKRGEFSKMVIFYEILNVTTTAVIAILSIFIISFFKDFADGGQIHSVSLTLKFIITIFTAVIAFILIRPIFRFQVFFRGERHKFEINFLKSLNFSKIFKFRNQVKGEKIICAWNSFWSEKSEFNERVFTNIFISHIDSSIKYEKFELAIQLAQTYVNNIEKRESFSMGYEILPKVFKWNEDFWNGEKSWLKSYDTEKKIQNFFLQKYFPTFIGWTLKFYKKANSKRERFWNWHYFQQDFFPAVAKILLKDGYQLFACFKKHIDEVYAKMEEIQNDHEKQNLWNYISGLFGSFCKVFFDNVNSVPSGFDIWEHYFPEDWKITHKNSDKKIPRIILHEFLQWGQPRIFKNKESDYDEGLSDVANGLFPNAHNELFPAFLVLLFATEVKYAIKKEPSFSIINTSISYSDEKTDQEIQQMFADQSQSQKAETIDIIFDYFSNSWRYLKIYKDDISEEEFSNWNSYAEDQKKEIVKRVRKKKLQEALNELNSQESINSCKDPEILEYQRKAFVELITLLLARI